MAINGSSKMAVLHTSKEDILIIKSLFTCPPINNILPQIGMAIHPEITININISNHKEPAHFRNIIPQLPLVGRPYMETIGLSMAKCRPRLRLDLLGAIIWPMHKKLILIGEEPRVSSASDTIGERWLIWHIDRILDNF